MKNLLFTVLIGLSISGYSQTMNLNKRVTNFPEMKDLLFVDFDQDGDEDLVGIEDSVLKFYIKDSLANFSASSSSFTVAGDRLISEDFNLDGFSDILVYGANQHRVYLSSGNGLFTDPADLVLLDSGEKEYHDMDGDGDLDLVSSIINGGVKVYENLNNLGFSSGTLIFENGGSLSTNEIGVGDINHDGINDIVRFSGDNSIFAPDMSYYISNDSLNITIDTTITTNIVTEHFITFEDFNNDNYDDVMVSSNVYLYDTAINNYSFSYNIPEWNPGANTRLIDVDNDGFLDIFINRWGGVNCSTCQTFKFYINSGDGSFSLLDETTSNFYWELGHSIDVSDIDNDGDVDILFKGKFQYHNNGNDIYGLANPIPLNLSYDVVKSFNHSSYRDGFDFADIDHDGDLDLIQIGSFSSSFDGRCNVFENKGNESSRYVFEEKPTFLPGFNAGKCSLLDLNGDQNPDLFTYGSQSSGNKAYYNLGTGFSFVNNPQPYFMHYTLYPDYSLTKLDGDSLVDIVFEALSLTGHILLFKTQTDSLTFELYNADTIPFEGDYKFIDLDEDGDQDLVVGGGYMPDLVTVMNAAFYENDGNGIFVEVPNFFPTNLLMNNIQFGDIDLDGDMDIIAASSGFYTHFNILLQQPGMVFEYDTLISNIPQENFEFELVDIDGDLDLDIGILPLANNSSFKMFLNDSIDFNLMPITGITSTFSKGFVKFLDMNGDSILDIFMADKDKVEFYMNSLCQATIHNETVISCNEYISPYSGNVYSISGEYLETLSVLNSNGCDSIVKLNVTINQTMSDTLFVESCTPYLAPNNVDIWNETGVYIDSNINANGCDSVKVYNFTLSPITNDIIANSTNELSTTNSLDNIQWLNCNNDFEPIPGETNQTYIPSANGSYAIEFNNGICLDTSECFTVNNIGVNDISNAEQSFYPNPFNNILNIGNKGNEMWITNLTGKIIWKTSETKSTDHLKINTENWVSGIYIIHQINGEIIKTKKLIKL